MKKLLLNIPLLGFSFTYPDFSLCYKKYKNYSIIPISRHYSVTAIKPKKYIKYDENYGLYLIKENNKHYFHFRNSHLGVWLASIKKGSIYSGNYAEYPDKNIPAKFSTKTQEGAIMSDIFCHPVGIGVNGGFLTKSQIEKFITSKPSQSKTHILENLGIILDKNLTVTKVIPNSWADKHFITVGSKIIQINNTPVKNLNDIKLSKNVTITFDVHGIIWSANIKGK
jgi:hypothetical protein